MIISVFNQYKSFYAFIIVFLFLSYFLACSSHPSVLTKKEFATIYLDSLKNKYTHIKFELNSDLVIVARQDSNVSKHFIDNAYDAYKSEPDSIKRIIYSFLTSTENLYINNQDVKPEYIMPLIKSKDFFNEIKKSLNMDVADDSLPMVTEKYNNELIISYVIDNETSMKSLTQDDLKKLKLSKDALKKIALNNLEKMLPNVQLQTDHSGSYILIAGGNYEASLILLSSIWNKKKLQVDGDFVITIPNRDILLVTGSNNKAGIDKLKENAQKSYSTNGYIISNHLFKLANGKFEKFD